MKIRMKPGGLAAILVSLPLFLHAQPAIEQFERTQRQMSLEKPPVLNLSTNREAPELYPGENTDVGPQRILRLNPRRSLFEVLVDSQAFFSDNAYLSDDRKIASAIFVNTIHAAVAPDAIPLGGGLLSPMVGYRSQWFNYEDHDNLERLNFNAQTAFINGRYQKGKWQFYAGFDFTRLLDQDRYEEQYREYLPTLMVQRIIPINDKLLILAGPQFNYHLTDIHTNSTAGRHVNDRYDAAMNVSLLCEISPRLLLQPFYRFQFSRYSRFMDGSTVTGIPRNDFIHSVGGSLTYFFTKSIAVRAFSTFELKQSDYSRTYEYHKFDAGGGLTLDFRF